ncbi:MAG TPA: hypothetical protein VMQ45_12115 [Burkholderiaceae bacterium]|nr:hypothetical protein [Burkholderiaceae bacterium]
MKSNSNPMPSSSKQYKLDSNQHKGVSSQYKLNSNQWKLPSGQKPNGNQSKALSPGTLKQPATSAQQKITSDQLKQTTSPANSSQGVTSPK